MPDFSTLPMAYAGPEGPDGSPNPQPGQTGFLAGTRNRAIGNAAFQMSPTDVCQLPNIQLAPGLAPIQPNRALLVVEINGDTEPTDVLVRMWMDGTAPSTITGIPLYAGQTYEIIGQDDLANTRLISADGNQHVLQIQYFSGYNN